MARPDKKTWAGLFIGAGCLILFFGAAVYVSGKGFESPSLKWLNRNLIPHPDVPFEVKPALTVREDRITLEKGRRTRIKRTGLVFKGMENGLILVDIYLEELDPDHPYPMKISKQDRQGPVRMGELFCRITAVKASSLTLDIDRASAPY